MSVFNIGTWELMAILAIAILLIGPKRVVEIARAIGRATAHMRQLSDEFLGTLRTEFREVEQEARQALQDAGEKEQQPIASIPTELQAVRRETRQAAEEIRAGLGNIVKGKRNEEAHEE